ncbi:MAG TPA: hypothetical protein VGB53_15475 [Rubricoccaceae bacterium]|jgi:transcription antitermination factor NusG
MLDRREINALWFAEQLVPGVRFRLNDAVRIVSGPASGAEGSVISLDALEPEPTYLVELSGGADVRVPERALDAAV